MVDKFEKALYDKLQTKLGVNGITPNNFKYAKMTLQDIIKDKTVLCPFCLEILHITDFVYSQGFYQCDKCKNRMTQKTLELMFKWFSCEKPQIQEFAKFVYGYRLNGFFQKINFKEWTRKLYDLGLSYDFWENYKRLKGEDKSRYDNEESEY